MRQQGWYKHIGLGRNIRTADLPLPYTKMMAHHFLQAPDHFTVEGRCVGGRCVGWVARRCLASAVVATRLGRSFEHEDFWQTVLHFFVNEPMLDLVRMSAPSWTISTISGSSRRRMLIEEGELGQRPSPAESDNEGTHPKVALEAGRGVA